MVPRALNYKNDKFVAVGVPEAETSANLILFAFESCSDNILFFFPPWGWTQLINVSPTYVSIDPQPFGLKCVRNA